MSLYKYVFIVLMFLGSYPAFSFLATEEGGVIGGGGGITKPSLITPEMVKDFVKKSRYPLYIYYSTFEWDYKKDVSYPVQPSYEASLIFKSEKNVFDILDQLQVEVELKKPCFDSQGNQKEASVRDFDKFTICLSADLISRKLNKYNAYPEVIALIGHEISHLLGMNEEQALWFQEDMLQKFWRQEIGNLSLESFMISHSIQDVPNLWFYFSINKEKLKISQGSCEYTTHYIRNLNSLFSNFYKISSDLHPLRAEEMFLKETFILKAHALRLFVCAHDIDVEGRERDRYKSDLENIFMKQDQITVQDFEFKYKKRRSPYLPEVLIRKIQMDENGNINQALIKEVSDLEAYLIHFRSLFNQHPETNLSGLFKYLEKN